MILMSKNETSTADLEESGITLSDARLVEDVRRGDRDAYGGLVMRYERRLIGVILRFVHDAELSRDLAQETFLRAFERLDQFDPSRRFGPWLFRIGVNLALDYPETQETPRLDVAYFPKTLRKGPPIRRRPIRGRRSICGRKCSTFWSRFRKNTARC